MNSKEETRKERSTRQNGWKTFNSTERIQFLPPESPELSLIPRSLSALSSSSSVNQTSERPGFVSDMDTELHFIIELSGLESGSHLPAAMFSMRSVELSSDEGEED